MNGIKFTLKDGKAATAEDTIVGSALDMMTAVKNLTKFANISFEEALICATKSPAEMVGIYETTGSIEVGKRADIVLCDKDMNIREVYCAGKSVFN
jgi:N-acetylglucosamine-6-phosphate deacetylase